MEKEIVWRPLKKISVSDYEAWIEEMDFEPYLHDPLLQSIDWVKGLTKAIKKVAPLVGEGYEIEYEYWGDLQSWEFILNCLSIARATGTFALAGKKASWKQAIDQLKLWVVGKLNDSRFRDLFSSGTHFFWDMQQFFVSGRQLSDPKILSKEVLGFITE